MRTAARRNLIHVRHRATLLGLLAGLSLGASCGGAVTSTGNIPDASSATSSDRDAGVDSGNISGRDAAVDARDEARDAPRDTFDAAPDAGFCGSAATELTGGCGDPLTDPHNCGACGHDCGGGSCEGGACIPLPPGVLASGQYSPSAIVVDSENVYWVNSGLAFGTKVKDWFGAQLLRCAISGCGNRPTVLASLTAGATEPPAAAVPSALTLDANTLYWSESKAIRSCSKEGCDCRPKTLLTVDEASGVAVSPTDIYFALWGSGQVQSCPIAGCSEAPTTLATSESGPSGLTIDGSDLYWTTPATVEQCSLGGCAEAPTSLWVGAADSLQRNARGITLDSTNLYWTNAQPSLAGSVFQCAKSNCGGTLVTLATRRSDPLGIASDGQNVYWAEPSGIMQCAVGGCNNAPTAIAMPGGPAVAVDANNVYFTQAGATSTDGRIVMLAKGAL